MRRRALTCESRGRVCRLSGTDHWSDSFSRSTNAAAFLQIRSALFRSSRARGTSSGRALAIALLVHYIGMYRRTKARVMLTLTIFLYISLE